jgi:hypothetical protein
MPPHHWQNIQLHRGFTFFALHFFEMVKVQLCFKGILLNHAFRCDHIIESDLLRHLQLYGRRYGKIDLRGCNKLTGTVLFRECEKRALSEGLISNEAIYDCK